MGNSLRPQPAPSIFEEMHTPVTSDILQVGLLVAFAMIAFSFLLILPGIRGTESFWAFIRVSFTLWVGAVLLACNYGSWSNDKICTRTQFKAHTEIDRPQTIQAEVGLSIGLRGINVTLIEKNCGESESEYIRPFPDETINYNERFRWSDPWGQGRRDFGIYGGRFNQEYRAAKYRGLPYPIAWIAEFFTLDGEQLIWYRKYRLAGWYTHIFLWTAFATYLVSILLFIYDIHSGAILMLITGLLMILASSTYGVLINNDPPLKIHFWDGNLKPKLSYSFYLVMFTGVVTWLLALVVLIVNRVFPRTAASIFHHSIIADDSMFEGLLEDEDELTGLTREGSRLSRVSYGLRRGGSIISHGQPGEGGAGRGGVWRKIQRRGGTRQGSVRSVRSDTQERAFRSDGVRRTSEPSVLAAEVIGEVSDEQESEGQTVTIPLEEISVHS